jgi:tRNA threonylcarbamoyladenosine modification (KEOPS) complex Cgi121 subunit
MIIKKIVESDLEYKFVGISAIKVTKIDSVQETIDFINEFSKKNKVEIQLLNADIVASWEHLFFSAINALKSFRGKYNIANILGIELLLYISGNRQINEALDKFGLDKRINNIAVVVFFNEEEKAKKLMKDVCDFLGGSENLNLLKLNQEKFTELIKIFGVQPEELTNLTVKNTEEEKFDVLIKIIIDRGAMVSLEK